jgi:hypothetical protein
MLVAGSTNSAYRCFYQKNNLPLDCCNLCFKEYLETLVLYFNFNVGSNQWTVSTLSGILGFCISLSLYSLNLRYPIAFCSYYKLKYPITGLHWFSVLHATINSCFISLQVFKSR